MNHLDGLRLASAHATSTGLTCQGRELGLPWPITEALRSRKRMSPMDQTRQKLVARLRSQAKRARGNQSYQHGAAAKLTYLTESNSKVICRSWCWRGTTGPALGLLQRPMMLAFPAPRAVPRAQA
jgi:hypothetical protein